MERALIFTQEPRETSLWSHCNKASISPNSSQPQALLGTHSEPKSLPPPLVTKARPVHEVRLSIFQKANRAGLLLGLIQSAGGNTEGEMIAVPLLTHLANVISS